MGVCVHTYIYFYTLVYTYKLRDTVATYCCLVNIVGSYRNRGIFLFTTFYNNDYLMLCQLAQCLVNKDDAFKAKLMTFKL